MLNIANTLRSVDDLLVRAGTRLADGAGTSAQHLLAKGGRLLDEIYLMPTTTGTRSVNAANVADDAFLQVIGAHMAIDAHDPKSAQSAIDTARFAIDLLLPG